MIEEELKEKQHLVVLDHIWRNEAWDGIKRTFPKGNLGIKVLFTTRNKDVATYADPLSPQIEPPLLTLEESSELLLQKASPHKY